MRRRYQGIQSQWGPLRLYSQTLVEKHLQGCAHRGYEYYPTKRTFGITYHGLASIMQTAFDLSYRMSFGAGGRCMSRELRYVSIIDQHKAPVFRLVELMRHFTWDLSSVMCQSDDFIGINEWRKLIDMTLGRINWLFEERLASPGDANDFNETIMYGIMSMV